MLRFKSFMRHARVKYRQFRGAEPIIHVDINIPLEFHGSSYGGWSIPVSSLSRDSIIVDVGLGEDISFATSLIGRYDSLIHGFDPTPRALDYVSKTAPRNFKLYNLGLSSRSGKAILYLPNNDLHVSGSLDYQEHTGQSQVEINVVNIVDLFKTLHVSRVDLLKLDIEGSEYCVLMSEEFSTLAPFISIICVEFHHRWPNYGRASTEAAVARLKDLGFACVWRNPSTNEEFTFVRK